MSKTTNSEVQDLVSLTLSILDKPPKFYELGDNGVFKEKEQQFKHNFKECIENADKGYLVSFFVEEVTFLSQKTALSEGLSVESPYVLLINSKRIPISDADDLERKVIWIEYFKTYNDSKGLDDFLADREQDRPREIDL